MPEPSDDLLSAAHWTLIRTPIDLVSSPQELAAADSSLLTRLPCRVPGTAAAAWRDAFGLAAALDLDTDAWDWWFLGRFSGPNESLPLSFESAGIASYATVWLDDQAVASSSGAFDELSASLELSPGQHEIAIHCRSLSSVPVPSKPRGRWRSALVSNNTLRWHRTQLLGHIRWHGTAKTVGPWAPLRLRPSPTFQVRKVLSTLLGDSNQAEQADGEVSVGLVTRQATSLTASVRDSAGQEVASQLFDAPASAGLVFKLSVPNPQRWFPHTHGTPEIYRLSISDGETTENFDLGFRSVQLNGADGAFELSVNGRAVFCRGAVWQPLDPLSLNGSASDYRAAIASMASAGINMLRISGTGSYEQPAFYQECDRQGVMVWHDLMLATFDPPEDAAWLQHFEAESRRWLQRLAGHPALTVLSGGNETEQQPTLWGLPAEARGMTVIDRLIPELVAEELPAAVHLSSSPSGGSSPVEIRQGVSHYFGVGAYKLPLSDARTSNVRFAAECLAFANPPEPSAVEHWFPGLTEAAELPREWQRGIASDPGAKWTFEDTTAHYAEQFFGAEPMASPARRMDLHRAASHQAIYRSLIEWRRPASSCRGAIVLSARDFTPGAGWGITDSSGRPKAAWYAVKAASSSTTLTIVPEQLNGLDLHLFHDGPTTLEGTVVLTVSSVSGVEVGRSEFPFSLPAASAQHWAVDPLLGGFRDLDYVWKFGEREYDCLTAVLLDTKGRELSRTVQLLGGIQRSREDVGLEAKVIDQEWLEVRTKKLATFVALDLADHHPEDNYFHLAAGDTRRIRCLAINPEKSAQINGTVRALNDLAASWPIRSADSTSKGNSR
ncbi:glycoside hydrolase family 2 protein [Psychromicrobium lacuslunae]|uniref:glycoside hydrolase family 2 protein n=1 Tax=Psychromicrobium lacuslunae TaxID=1618207 RepID=UPI000ADF413E|nr:glycoside hydrolase family 2 protein [Psychromicrobium lacuslunae]